MDLTKIMRVCIILHNIIVEDERDTYATPFDPLQTYDDATNGLSQSNLEEEPFVPNKRYIFEFVTDRSITNHKLT